MNKKTLVEHYVRDKEYKKALAICKNWILPISAEEAGTLQRGYECMHYPRLYEQIGYNPQEEIKEAIKILERVYLK